MTLLSLIIKIINLFSQNYKQLKMITIAIKLNICGAET